MDERFGADIVVTKNICTNDDGELVLEAYTTLMSQFNGDQSAKLRWDSESGQVVRTGVIGYLTPAPMYTRASGFSQHQRAFRESSNREARVVM
ncbi:hypothetical protein L837_5105 [Mycobacterium avium MAV_061107_1842]|nr:hypothetical protein L837_5105 [Mycobacterium avium MAV_061107_1842]